MSSGASSTVARAASSMEPAIGPLRISTAGDDACGSGSVRFVDRAATGEDCLATASEELLETGWQDTSRHPQKISHAGKVVSVHRSSSMFTLPCRGQRCPRTASAVKASRPRPSVGCLGESKSAFCVRDLLPVVCRKWIGANCCDIEQLPDVQNS